MLETSGAETRGECEASIEQGAEVSIVAGNQVESS